MAGRHSEEGAPVEGVLARDRRQVVDVTDLSPREIRARVADLRDGHEARVERARDELVLSIGALREGLAALQVRTVTRLRGAVPLVAGAAAVGAAAVVLVRVAGARRTASPVEPRQPASTSSGRT